MGYSPSEAQEKEFRYNPKPILQKNFPRAFAVAEGEFYPLYRKESTFLFISSLSLKAVPTQQGPHKQPGKNHVSFIGPDSRKENINVS